MYDGDDTIHYSTHVRLVEEVNLGGWLEDLSNPEMAPNYAVSLYQTPSLTQDSAAGMHIGLLLKSCGRTSSGGQLRLVKIGMFFTNVVDILSVETVEVDWAVL